MRLVRLLFSFILLAIFGAVLLLFLAQNWGMTRVDFFGLQYTIHLAWVLAGAAAFGGLTILVLLMPGRLAAVMHTWSLERELRQWEQDLWKLQARHERLLARQEHLMEAHERVLQSYHRLVGEHSQVAAQRDQARTELAAARTSLASALSAAATLPGAVAHQPVLHSSTPTMSPVAVVSPAASGSSSASGMDSTAPKAPAASRPHAHSMPRVVHSGRTGGRASLPPASRAPRWAARWPAARAPVRAAHPADASLQVQGTAGEQAVSAVGEIAPAREHPVVNEPLPLPSVAASAEAHAPIHESPPVPTTAPVLPAVEKPTLRAGPRTVPLPVIEAAAPALPASPAVGAAPTAIAPMASSAAPQMTLPAPTPAEPAAFSGQSLRTAADRSAESLGPVLATLRTQLRADIARMADDLTAKRVVVQTRLGDLLRAVFLSELPLDPFETGSTPGDDEWS
jgi:hypothetical protein